MSRDSVVTEDSSSQDDRDKSLADFADVMNDVLGITIVEIGDEIEFRMGRNGERTIGRKPAEEVLDVLGRVNELQPAESLGLAFTTGNSFELAVDASTPAQRFGLREDIEVTNPAQGLTYSLGRASIEFSLACARLMMRIPRRDRLVMPSHMQYRSLDTGRRNEALDPFTFISESIRLPTLRISSSQRRSDSQWRVLSESLFFHLGFNLDLALSPRQSIDEMSRANRIQRLRRATIEDLDAPQRNYIPELVRSYQLGLASESPMLSYLSFYHVAEHWFEEVFLDDVATRVQLAITSPEFSAKRKKDIQRVIRTVSKSLKARDESVIINEATALQLTLEKYVDVAALSASLTAFDPSLISYYSDAPVGFSSGDAVDFSAPAPEVRKRLAQRIYKTRNALVHRKDGDKARFTPFKDDIALRREIPLMRFIAEAIIIDTATIL